MNADAGDYGIVRDPQVVCEWATLTPSVLAELLLADCVREQFQNALAQDL